MYIFRLLDFVRTSAALVKTVSIERLLLLGSLVIKIIKKKLFSQAFLGRSLLKGGLKGIEIPLIRL